MLKIPMKKKYKLLINTGESAALNHFNGPKAYIRYSNRYG